MKKADCDWSSQEPQFGMGQLHIVMWEQILSDAQASYNQFEFTPLNGSHQTSAGFIINDSDLHSIPPTVPVIPCAVPGVPSYSAKPNGGLIAPTVPSQDLAQTVKSTNPISGLSSVTAGVMHSKEKAIAPVAVPKRSPLSAAKIAPSSSVKITPEKKKAFCTAQLVRQLVLGSKKSATRPREDGYQGYAAYRRSSGLVGMDKNQNEERLRKVRENLMKIKQEKAALRAASGGQPDTSLPVNQTTTAQKPTNILSAVLKVQGASMKRKQDEDLFKPLPNKPSKSDYLANLIRNQRKEKVFEGFSSRKLTGPQGNVQSIVESGAQWKVSSEAQDTVSSTDNSTNNTTVPSNKKAVVEGFSAGKLTGSQDNVQSDTTRDSGGADSASFAPNKKAGPVSSPGAWRVPQRDGWAKSATTTAASPKKSVTFNPVKRSQVVTVGDSTHSPASDTIGCKIEFATNSANIAQSEVTSGKVNLANGEPPAAQGSPRASPGRRPMVPELNLKRHTPSHVLKRLVSPPRGRLVVPPAGGATVSTPVGKNRKYAGSGAKVNKVKGSDNILSYLTGSVSPIGTQRRKAQETSEIRFLGANDSVIAKVEVDSGLSVEDLKGVVSRVLSAEVLEGGASGVEAQIGEKSEKFKILDPSLAKDHVNGSKGNTTAQKSSSSYNSNAVEEHENLNGNSVCKQMLKRKTEFKNTPLNKRLKLLSETPTEGE